MAVRAGAKRTLRVFFLLAAAAVLLSTAARAAPPELSQALPDGLAEILPDGLAEAAEEEGVLAGGASWLASAARASAAAVVRESTRSAALLLLVALICGAAEGLADGAGETAARYVPFCGVLAVSALATGDLRTMLGLGAETVEELSVLSRLLLPALAASMAAGGYVTTAGVWQVTTLAVCGVLNDAVSRLLLPLLYCYLAAAAAGAVLEEGRLGVLADSLKTLVSGALTFAAAAFTSYLAVAGVLTGSADRTAVKAARVVLSGAVPIVGGVLSDAAESVLSAAGTLRATVGALGVFAIGALCLTPLLRLAAQYLLYRLAAFAAGLVGTKALASYLDRLGGAFALVFAMTAVCALVLLAALLVAASVATG